MEQQGGVNQRQLSEMKKAITVLHAKMTAGLIDDHVSNALHAMAQSMSQNDFRSALRPVSDLSKSHWTQHKDWLKGVKNQTQLAAKRFS